MDLVTIADHVETAYVRLAPIVLGVGVFLVLALPIVGRFLVALGRPRVGEALIRLGSDIGAVVPVAKLPPGSPAPSALPLDQSSAMARSASTPPPRPQRPTTPTG